MVVTPKLSHTRDDAGFTLVELLVAIVILGVITAPLANFVIGYFRFTADNSARLNESHDVQIASAYFSGDVAALGIRDQTTLKAKQSVWVGTSTGAPYACGSASPVLLLAADQATIDAATGQITVAQVEISYAVATVSGERLLTRTYCASSSATAVNTVLAHDVDPNNDPAVTCFLNGASTPCSGADTSLPTSVQLALTLKDPLDSSNYPVVLSGQRRQT